MSALQSLDSLSNNETAPPQSLEDRMLGILACFSVAWGLLMLISFTLFITADPARLAASYGPDQVAYLLATPAWVLFAKSMTAIGVLCGAVYLLLRKQSAHHWFMISLAGTVLVMLDSGLRGGYQLMAGMETGVNVGIVIVGIFLYWASYSAFADGHLSE